MRLQNLPIHQDIQNLPHFKIKSFHLLPTKILHQNPTCLCFIMFQINVYCFNMDLSLSLDKITLASSYAGFVRSRTFFNQAERFGLFSVGSNPERAAIKSRNSFYDIKYVFWLTSNGIFTGLLNFTCC